MNILRITAITAFLSVGAAVHGADLSSGNSKGMPKLPQYPHQPKINAALKNLTQAQKHLGASGSESTKSIVFLKKAKINLEDTNNRKGSFRATALRLTGQAIKHLERPDLHPDGAATAKIEIEQAIKACHDAGKYAER